MHLHQAEAIILRHLDYGEADRIVTFLTAEHGLCRGFARSARKSRKRFGAALEPFAQVRLHWGQRGGELLSLREAELIDLRVGLRSDLRAIALASYACELLEQLLGDAHGHPGGYRLLCALLDHLAAAGEIATPRLLFELRLLDEAGYMPHLLHCSDCNLPLAGPAAAFAASRGGSLCLQCASDQSLRLHSATLGSLSRSLRTPPTLFAGFRFSPQTLAEGHALLAEALRLHLPRPLKTQTFLEQLAEPEKS